MQGAALRTSFALSAGLALGLGRGKALCATLLAIALLAGCSARPGPEVLTPVAAPAGSKLVKIFVATNRDRETPETNVFTNRRAHALNYAEFTIAIPADHRPGRVELAGVGGPGFVVVEQHVLDETAFKNRIGLSGKGRRKQDVMIFVHGYNNNFQEALFRHAQVTADAGFESTQILFAWPSRAQTSGYVADKDAVTYSRDYLAALLAGLANEPRVGRIRLAAHSMGSWLTVETLRELRLLRRDNVIRRMEVILAAPDIDGEVFAQQLRVVGPLTPPMKILVAGDDRALQVSGFIAGSSRRIGSLDISDPRVDETVKQARIQVFDISKLRSSDGLGHDRFVQLAALYPELAKRPIISETGVFLIDTAGTIVRAPLAIVDAPD